MLNRPSENIRIRHYLVFLTLNIKQDFLIHNVIIFPLKRLPYKSIEDIIELSLFSEPLSSYSTLYIFQSITETKYQPLLNQKIIAIFKSQRIRRQIQTEQQLYPDFDYTRCYPYIINYSTRFNLPLQAISNCPKYFEFLFT